MAVPQIPDHDAPFASEEISFVDLAVQTAVDCDAGDEAPKQAERPSTSTPSAGWGRADRSYHRSSTTR
jgi:hypothetical protein